jgi:IPT/TIG domain-containing protein
MGAQKGSLGCEAGSRFANHIFTFLVVMLLAGMIGPPRAYGQAGYSTATLQGTVLDASFQPLPRCTAVEPDTGKVGDLISVKGENLNKASIVEVYLTDGSKDTKATITEQTDTQIKFRVPEVKPGRYHLAMLTANRASIIEQPVVLTVE